MQINGYPVIASIEKNACTNVVVIDRGVEYGKRYVVAYHHPGDTEWSLGMYYTEKAKALSAMSLRAGVL